MGLPLIERGGPPGGGGMGFPESLTGGLGDSAEPSGASGVAGAGRPPAGGASRDGSILAAGALVAGALVAGALPADGAEVVGAGGV